MIDTDTLRARWTDTPLEPWGELLEAQVAAGLALERYGDLPRWQGALASLPDAEPSSADLSSSRVTVGTSHDLTDDQRDALIAALKGLHPWRKGPFEVFGVHLDTEWRSDWKWDRLCDHIAPLDGRRVLDVGCGSGYHCWRMRGDGASEVIGIDPTPLFVVQFAALQKYLQDDAVWVLPMGIEAVPEKMKAFDTVFSMGVLYHRRSPMEHLQTLRDAITPGGQLVLETLVIEGDENACLVPEGRYARMGNVWFLPSSAQLLSWLAKLGFQNPRVVDESYTTVEEQRSTEWMSFHSLAQFLDPEDSSKTIEGHPAPRRAVLIAETTS